MAEDTESTADPSMEEILASIRRIISDDENPPEEAKEPEAAAEPEEVLELTQAIQDDGSVQEVEPESEPEAPPEPEPEPAPEPEPEPEPEPAPPPPPPPPPEPEPPPPMPEKAAEPLVSEPVASTAASALSSLANTLEIERLASAPPGSTYVGNGYRTLEDMVVELMRPMLREWLEKNLSSIVEKLVQKEIDRISKRG